MRLPYFFSLFYQDTCKNAIFAIQISVTKMESSPELRVSPMRGAMTIGAATAGGMLVFNTFMPILTWLVFFGGIYFGMRTYRKVLDGIIIYFNALNVGFQTAFFASLIMAFFIYMTATIDSSFIAALVDAAEEQWKTSGMSSELTEVVVQQLRATLTPVMLAIITIFMYTAVGGIAGIILAFFVRTAKRGEFVEY